MEIEGSRRRFLVAAGLAAVVPPLANAQDLQHELKAPRPNPSSFRSGDLVWPKNPNAYVPYASGSDNNPEEDRKAWNRERDIYVASLESRRDRSADDERRLELLRDMGYHEFISVYEGDQAIGTPGLYSGGAFYVGHVGIIDVDQEGTPWVVEALLKKGVIRQTYADWLKSRPGEMVWHGRLSDTSSADGVALTSEAKKHIGKAYDFWNFDLNDDRVFYCSKLVWLSAFRALGIAADNEKKTKRLLWFSPKQLLYAKRMQRLHDPGSYGSA